VEPLRTSLEGQCYSRFYLFLSCVHKSFYVIQFRCCIKNTMNEGFSGSVLQIVCKNARAYVLVFRKNGISLTVHTLLNEGLHAIAFECNRVKTNIQVNWIALNSFCSLPIRGNNYLEATNLPNPPLALQGLFYQPSDKSLLPCFCFRVQN
jgi:hypothetical protein